MDFKVIIFDLFIKNVSKLIKKDQKLYRIYQKLTSPFIQILIDLNQIEIDIPILKGRNPNCQQFDL